MADQKQPMTRREFEQRIARYPVIRNRNFVGQDPHWKSVFEGAKKQKEECGSDSEGELSNKTQKWTETVEWEPGSCSPDGEEIGYDAFWKLLYKYLVKHTPSVAFAEAAFADFYKRRMAEIDSFSLKDIERICETLIEKDAADSEDDLDEIEKNNTGIENSLL